jgi:FkbM family methyltransferase
MISLPPTIRIFGTGRFAADLAKAVEHRGTQVVGFVQTTPTAAEFMNKPVLAVSHFASPDEVPLFIGVFNYTAGAAYHTLHAELAPHFQKLVFPMEFYGPLAEQLGFRYWLSASPSDAAMRVKTLFSDDQSKRVLEQAVAFRRGEVGAMQGTLSPGSQYFIPEVIRALPPAVRWVDAGAFDGDTLVDSMRYFKSSAVTAFEPDPENLEKLHKRVAHLELPLWVLPLGVSNRSGLVSFAASLGGASSLTLEGNTTIALARLDDVMPTQNIDFLKIDIEGADLDVLEGAAKIITRSQPVIAIAAYHTPEHLFEVPERLHALLPKHQLLLRSHASNTFDTICYAIPA